MVHRVGEMEIPNVAGKAVLGSLSTPCETETGETEAEQGERAGFGNIVWAGSRVGAGFRDKFLDKGTFIGRTFLPVGYALEDQNIVLLDDDATRWRSVRWARLR